MLRRFSLRVALLACFPVTASSALPDYGTFELQARSNLLVNDEGYNLPPGSSFNSISADIDDEAMVAFRVQLVRGQNVDQYRPGLWYGGGGNGGIVHTGPVDASIDNDVTITHPAGTSFRYVPFTLSETGVGNTLYVYTAMAGIPDPVHPFNTAPLIANSYGYPRMSSSGAMSFQANYSSGRALATVVPDGDTNVISQFIGDRGVTPESPFTYLYTPSFNDRLDIAAKVAYSDDMTSAVEIRLFHDDGSAERILANDELDPDSPYSKFDNSLALDGNGTVAVVATRAADNRRVLLRSDGTTTVEIAAVDPAGTIRGIEFFAPAINDAGMVAFRATDANGQAIYVGDGVELKRVIGNGDVVQTDLGTAQIGQDNASDPIFSGKPSINARGDVVFIAGLYPEGDNQIEWGSGVFVAYAEPLVVDEIFASGFES
ncbi:MAG TPA: choice-of-anchor tandem repeat NxxGxxAF-containing protein [Tahibacter sp.]|nr:choice-of-anchor tandem repeat NxxGxxAF-containing protein [Tahibacter sp.]